MKNLKDILYSVTLTSVKGTTDLNVNAIVFDSRKANENSIFVAIKGTAVDGHDFISSVIEKHPAFANAKLLKIDTDGFDNKIIRGAATFLRQSKASIFFEYDPFYLAKQNENGPAIFDFLVDLGYDKWVIFDNHGRYLITLTKHDKHLFESLHQYYNQEGNVYMDIWVIHESDSQLQYQA